MSHDQRLEEEVQRQVAVAMSQQQQAQTVPPEPSVAADSGGSSRGARGAPAPPKLP